MLADPFRNNTIDNMFTSVSLSTASDERTKAKEDKQEHEITHVKNCNDQSSKYIPGSTNGSLPNHFRYFKLFPYLNDDIKFTILSYIADAPFDKLPECYPVSTLTHSLPQVNRKFRDFAEHDIYWKYAIERACHKEPKLWKEALNRLCIDAKSHRRRSCKVVRKLTTRGYIDVRDNDDYNDGDNVTDAMLISEHSRRDSDVDVEDATFVVGHSLCKEEETTSELIDRACKTLRCSRLKDLFERVVNTQLRFKGAIYEKEGHVVLGEPYTLHLTEPKYCIMINEILKNHSVSARREGGQIRKDAIFIHMNRMPLQKSQTAVMVQVTRCEVQATGTFEIQVVPFQHVWIERVWQMPNTFGLLNGQVLKMGHKISNLMNHLVRQETMVQVMDNMVRAMAEASEVEPMISRPTAAIQSIEDDDDDDDSVLSNQYNTVTDGENDDDGDDDNEEEENASRDVEEDEYDSNDDFNTTDDDDDNYYDDDEDEEDTDDEIESL